MDNLLGIVVGIILRRGSCQTMCKESAAAIIRNFECAILSRSKGCPHKWKFRILLTGDSTFESHWSRSKFLRFFHISICRQVIVTLLYDHQCVAKLLLPYYMTINVSPSYCYLAIWPSMCRQVIVILLYDTSGPGLF